MRHSRIARSPSLRVIACAAVLGLLGFLGGMGLRQQVAIASTNDLGDLSRALVYMKQYYYKDLNTPEHTKDMVEDAINGMLATLDPHTVYHSPESFRRMQEDQKGEFFGIGVTFTIRNNLITVMSVIEDTPSSRLGIRPGDMIVKIEGEDAKGLTSNDVLKKLRGKLGSKVHISIKRPGLDDLLEFEITRATIPIYSVPYAYLSADGIGYVYITSFAEKTRDELVEKLNKLKAQGMKKLILDLRGNPGGLLKSAKEVTEVFLPKGVLIVETKGRISDSRMELYSDDSKSQTNLPVVVLVDGGSASASEIVSGAIQDHDRGLIVGTRSFGKGLVQRLYDLRGDAAIQVTTAQYYTPSGRCIQHPFKNKDFQLHITDGKITDKTDLEQEQKEKDKFYTDHNRVVYGGGGILPDVVVEQNLGPIFIAPFRAKSVFFNYAVEYVNKHQNDLKEDFTISDEMVKEFLEFAKEAGVEVDAEKAKLHDDVIRAWMAREIASSAFNATLGIQKFNQYDAQIKAAIENFPEAIRITQLKK